jgi:hypothetical protein
MTIFQKSVDQTTREYKVTMVVVSLITYLVALLSVIAVNWPHNKNKVLKWWKTRLQHTPVKDNSDTAPIPAQAAGSAPIPQESKTRDTERKAGPSNEQQDLESASNEEGGKRARFRSWWQKRAK